jgi:hypothetical protein
LIGDLLRDRLFPVVRELAAAMVRFEWYFKPLKIPDTGRRVVLSGLSTSSDDLDARMVLNAAEATSLGIAWFLALHMLQPAERRAVLVLDDPVSVFDPANLGGFVSTLRTFVRLTRPQQLIVATHDDAVAAMLADELTPCEGWPAGVSLLRCERDREDRSVVRVRFTNSEPAALERELQRLGLMTTA